MLSHTLRACFRMHLGCYVVTHVPASPTLSRSLVGLKCYAFLGQRAECTDSQMHSKRGLSRAEITFFSTEKWLLLRFFRQARGTPFTFVYTSFFSTVLCYFEVFWAFKGVGGNLLKIRK